MRRIPQLSPSQSSWRVRAESHYSSILELLRVRGSVGVLSSELYDCPEKFGRSPRNRISEARAAGFDIQTIQVSASVVRYVLRDCGDQLATQGSDWYTRKTGEARASVVPEESTTEDLPLFAGIAGVRP
jgi:hypothetical protein